MNDKGDSVYEGGSDPVPHWTEVISETLRLCFESTQQTQGTLFTFQKLCAEMTDLFGAAVPNDGFSAVSREAAEAMIAGFREEFQKILNIPPLGLPRLYQEHLNRTLETFASFHASLVEFFRLLAVPLEEAADVLRESMRKAGQDAGAGVQDPDALYRFWIGKLEEYYLSLLRSRRYTETLAKTLSSLYEYREARKEFLLDLLQDWPVATTRDVDEIGRDLYQLKKRVKKLEKSKDGK